MNQKKRKIKRKRSSEHIAPVVQQMTVTQGYRLKPSQTLQWPAATHTNVEIRGVLVQ